MLSDQGVALRNMLVEFPEGEGYSFQFQGVVFSPNIWGPRSARCMNQHMPPPPLFRGIRECGSNRILGIDWNF